MERTLDETAAAALAAYSRGEASALDLRRRLGDASFGEVLLLLRQAGLPLPRASQAGREEEIARASAWFFPDDGV